MRFRQKPVEVEAIQVGSQPYKKTAEWCGGGVMKDGRHIVGIYFDKPGGGVLIANDFDWIVRDANGDLCVCKSDIFDATYEAVP